MICATDISGKGGISEYISGGEGVLEVFSLVLGYCRVVLFDCFVFFFLEVFYTSYSSKIWLFWSQRGLWVRAVLWKLLQG